MSRITDSLREWGCDVTGALDRLANNERLYVECLGEMTEEPYFSGLDEAFSDGDIKRAFEIAHTLTGVSANLGLTPIYKTAAGVTETLRAGGTDGVSDSLLLLARQKRRLEKILAGR